MSRQFRYRVVALVLGGLLLGGPFLGNGTASAGQVNPGGTAQGRLVEGDHRVTFDGGSVFGLSCHSHPDVESMTVPANSTVRVVNQTGHNANLRLGKDTKGMLPAKGSIEVVFRRGTTAMTLTPTCTFGNDGSGSPVMVTAQPPDTPVATPGPVPDPSMGDLSTFANSSGDSDQTSDTAAPDILSTPVHHHSHAASSAGGHSTAAPPGEPDATAAPAAKGQVKGVSRLAGGHRHKAKVKPSDGTPGATAPALSSTPPSAQETLAPGVPALDVNPPGPAPAAVAAPATEIAAAEPMAALEPIPDRGPIGLLAVIAMVCALGVGIAAIRAFVSQRAIRSSLT
jgi:hypothetical protein